MAFTPCANITSGLNGTSCVPNPGGVRSMLICNFDDIVAIGTTGGTAFTINTISMTGASGFYPYTFRRNTANFQEDLSKDLTTGSLFYTQTGTIVLDHKDRTKRDELMLLDNALVAVIAEHSDGTYWLYGSGDGMYVTANVSQTGTAKTDANGYTITMVAEEEQRAYPVNPAIIAALTL